jgi:hypothetical protein
VADPPEGFSLHPRVVPFLTYDRYKWVNPEIEAKLKALNAAWERRADSLGWYDYVYGKFYVVPRVYFGVMRDYLRYAREHRVKALYAEAYPGWHEGPKLYLALRLQWDPDLDAAAVLDDWYRAAVGPAAAPHLAEYFAFWERYWTERVPASVWFTNPTTFDGTYLPYRDRRYLDGLTPADLERCRGLLGEALAKAGTPAQKARAGFFADGFARIAAEVAQGR